MLKIEIEDIDLKQLIENETGERFKKGYIKCPFHNEKTPSLSVKFFPDANKERFCCWGCSESGDSIDFIMKYKNLNYIEARKYLGLEVKKSIKEELEEKVKGYINWEISKFRQGQELLGIFNFVDENNEIKYFKAKFRNKDGTKQLAYYHIENNKVVAKRGSEELPYNLYNTIRSINESKIIIFVEGEKDVNTINSILKNNGFVATSIKGCKNLDVLTKWNIEKIYVLGDTGKAGEEYKHQIYKNFINTSKEFKFITLPGIKNMGDNKDVTDWIEAGNSRKDLLNAFKRSLDIKSQYELQQDNNGIYKNIYSKKDDEFLRKYLTNFKVIEATRIQFIDEETEGIKLILQSPTGSIIERTGLSTVFDDTKTFKNFLGTLDLGFKGKVDDLTDLKSWINKYFALEIQEIHSGVKFLNKNDELFFIENNGSISKNKINLDLKSDGRNAANVVEIESITKEELKEIKKYIFRFAPPGKSISIIGTIINNLAVYHAKELKIKLHHLLIVGESGSGKSTVLENVIAQILNYPKKDIRSIGLITPFALTKSLADGNYSILFDEFKPSSLDRYKILSLSEIFRNLYDRSTISRGNKSLKIKDFQLTRPLIMAGEESYPNQEKALIERSCIVYLSRREREDKHVQAMGWLMENEHILNKLGRSLIEVVLELSIDEYKLLREESIKEIKDLKNRTLNTATNICTGIKILNKLFKKHCIKEVKNYTEHIVSNIKEEVMEGAGETHSLVERMLILYNNMIEDGRALDAENVVKYRNNGVFIKTSEMISQIYEYTVRFGADLIPLKLKDFRKQAQKSGYLLGISDKLIKIDGKPVRFDTYNIDRLRELKVDSIVPPELQKINDGQDIPF